MQLGELLKTSPGVPCVVRRVKVQLLHVVAGLEHKTEAEALLVPVNDVLSTAGEREARTYLERQDKDPTSPYRWTLAEDQQTEVPGAPIPQDVLQAEVNRRFLLRCLRDVDNPRQPFVREADYATFRKALVPRQVEWLLAEYTRFLDEEYPETPKRGQWEALHEEASGES